MESLGLRGEVSCQILVEFLSLLLPACSWKSVLGCQPGVSYSSCPPSLMHAFFRAAHVTWVFCFRLTLNDSGSFVNTELSGWIASMLIYQLPSVRWINKKTPTTYGGKARKTPLFSRKKATSQPGYNSCLYPPQICLCCISAHISFFNGLSWF